MRATCKPGFRTHPSAAPLKRRGSADSPQSDTDFRTHPSAAPLKPCGWPPTRSLACFRTHPSAAPLKQSRLRPLCVVILPSALTRVRPR